MPKGPTRVSERAPPPSHGYPPTATCRKSACGSERAPLPCHGWRSERAPLPCHGWLPASGHMPKGPRSPSHGYPRAAAASGHRAATCRKGTRGSERAPRERPHAERAAGRKGHAASQGYPPRTPANGHVPKGPRSALKGHAQGTHSSTTPARTLSAAALIALMRLLRHQPPRATRAQQPPTHPWAQGPRAQRPCLPLHQKSTARSSWTRLHPSFLFEKKEKERVSV